LRPRSLRSRPPRRRVLPRQLRYGRCQDELGRGMGPLFVLYHDREFPHNSSLFLYTRACVLKKNYVGDLGVVLSRSKRKSNYERVREYRGGDSEWRGPGGVRAWASFLLATYFRLLFLPHVVPSLLSSIFHARRPTPYLGLLVTYQ
jgi:hypothetical protein